MKQHFFFAIALPLALFAFSPLLVSADEVIVPKGINDSFQSPDPKAYVERFEKESREVYHLREEVIKHLHLRPGMAIADVGAGTGFFTRLMAKEVGSEGKAYAVDIAKNFIDHIMKTCQEQGLKQVEGIVCTADDSKLAPNSVDLVFICDVYHHFEHPEKTMESIVQALRPGGRLALIEFVRNDDSSDWTKEHVRAGQDVFQKEIEVAGLELIEQVDIFKDNYFLIFRKK